MALATTSSGHATASEAGVTASAIAAGASANDVFDPLVVLERLAVAVAQLLEQLRRPLDVREQESDRPDRQLDA